jgi:hypothetical protein
MTMCATILDHVIFLVVKSDYPVCRERERVQDCWEDWLEQPTWSPVSICLIFLVTLHCTQLRLLRIHSTSTSWNHACLLLCSMECCCLCSLGCHCAVSHCSSIRCWGSLSKPLEPCTIHSSLFTSRGYTSCYMQSGLDNPKLNNPNPRWAPVEL